MRDAVAFVDHFDNVAPSQLASIERLAAGGGIKRRAIEIDALPVRTHGFRTHVNHASPEFGEVAVLVVEPVSHCTASLQRVIAPRVGRSRSKYCPPGTAPWYCCRSLCPKES